MVTLTPMTAEEYAAWYDEAVAAYAQERVRAGNASPEEAADQARTSFEQLLPRGLDTPLQHLYAIRGDGGVQVGVIWLAGGQPSLGLPGGTGFIYDLTVFPEFRRKGYGRAAMLAIEAEARALGLTALALHVFGHNATARRLYESIGYTPTNINMRKEIG